MSERDELAEAIAENNRLSYDAEDYFEAADALLSRGYRRSVTPDELRAANLAIDEINRKPFSSTRELAEACARAFGLEVTE